jgi:hypothetical protein
MLAVGVGASVCLSPVEVAAVSGTKGNDIAENTFATEFGGKITFYNYLWYGVNYLTGTGILDTRIVVSYTNTQVKTYGAGVPCSTYATLTASWFWYGIAPAGGADRYIKIRFSEDNGITFKYGWSQFTKDGTTFKFGAWSYNAAGGAIKTLADSVKTRRLALAGGDAMLHWTNGNEEGLASYAVQTERDGVWTRLASFVPGEGRYSLKAPGDGAYRLVTEWVDGRSDVYTF